MKSKIKLIGIIAFVAVIGLLLASCGEKEGTFTLENVTSAQITAWAVSGTSSTAVSDIKKDDNKKTIAAGEKGTWTLPVGDIVYIIGDNETRKTATIKKGETTAKKTSD
jgi:hypothetical protein